MSDDTNPTRKRGTLAQTGTDAQPIPSLARRVSMGRVQLIGKPL